MRVNEGDPLYCYFSREETKFVVAKYKSKEAVYVDHVKLCSNDTGTSSSPVELVRKVSVVRGGLVRTCPGPAMECSPTFCSILTGSPVV